MQRARSREVWALALVLGLFSPSAGWGASLLEGYAWPPSVTQGDTVHVCVNTDAPWVAIDFQREGAYPVTYLSVSSLPGVLQQVPADPWSNGCDWTPTYTFVVPASWPSGVYEAKLSAPSFGTAVYAIFTVRESQPGSTSTILFQNSINTWQAYNNWGGKSLYEHSSTDGVRSYTVSFRRPYTKESGLGDFPQYERKMIRFLEGQGYTLEYCTDIDTHRDPSLQDHYNLFLSVGHDEYWTKEMRDNIEARIAGGKNVAFFGGNTCWWQIRYSPDYDRIICYKDKDLDPLYGVDNSRVTVNWYKQPVSRPENSMTGVSFRYGGYVNTGTCLPASQGYGGYTAVRTWNWVYAGTGLTDGEVFGQPSTIVGYEVDGAELEMVGGLPMPEGQDGTPPSFVILATSEACEGSESSSPGGDRHATMGYYMDGGYVFQAATVEWSQGLSTDPVVQQITRNVVNQLLTLRVLGAEGPESGIAPMRLRAAPNPMHGSARIEFALDRPGDVHLRIFDVQGDLVRDLGGGGLGAGPHSVLWNGRDERGRPSAGGVYLLRLDTPGGPVTGRLLRVP